jgi:hypothetical protein
MMLSFTQGQSPGSLFLFELQRLKKLVADMEQIAAGTLPERLVVSGQTPVLDDWCAASVSSPCLVGRSSGHPRLPGTGRLITTSDLWLVSRDLSWARTRSRWYRLGEQHVDFSTGVGPEAVQ